MGNSEKRLTGLSKNRERERARARAFPPTNQETKGLLFKSHLQKYWMSPPAETYKSAFYSLRNFLDFQESRSEPAHEWDLWSALAFSEHRRTILSGKYDLRVKNGSLKCTKTGKAAENASKYAPAFREFFEIAGAQYLSESDLKILDVEAGDWGRVYQCPRKQAEQIPAPVLKAWGEYVSDARLGITERLFAWSFRVALACLRWDDLLNTAPTTAVLMEEGLIGFAAKNQNQGEV